MMGMDDPSGVQDHWYALQGQNSRTDSLHRDLLTVPRDGFRFDVVEEDIRKIVEFAEFGDLLVYSTTDLGNDLARCDITRQV